MHQYFSDFTKFQREIFEFITMRGTGGFDFIIEHVFFLFNYLDMTVLTKTIFAKFFLGKMQILKLIFMQHSYSQYPWK